MSAANIALLADRGVVRVGGEDAGKLLQGIITNDMDLLAVQPAIHAGLLTPQGKILFEFFVVKSGADYLLDTAAAKTAELAKRLAMYRLRAKATIADVSAAYCVLAQWGEAPAVATDGTIAFADPRLPALGWRLLQSAAAAATANASAGDYHAHRIALGIPEAGADYALGDTFPHEADFDLLGGVSFTKGCFVGQEVVSRMQNKTTIRKRVVPVRSDGALTPGADITVGAAVIGKVGSVAGAEAMAMLRLDRATEAKAKGDALTVGAAALALRTVAWFDPSHALAPAEAAT